MEITILTPEKQIFQGKAVSIQLPGSEGRLGVYDKHAAILVGLVPGFVVLKTESYSQCFCVGGGYFEFNQNKGILLADSAEKAEDINLSRAKEAQKRAENRLKNTEGIDIKRAKLALARSIARQKTASFNKDSV